jgi:predicted PurR-regulated permease PerM
MSLTDVDRSRAAWWGLGSLLFGTLAFVVYSFVGTLVFGVFIYYATRPVYRRIRRRIASPNLAAGVSIFALVLPALALVGYALLVVSQELLRLGTSTAFDPTDYGLTEDQIAEIQSLLDAVANPAALIDSGLLDYLSFGSISAVLTQLTAAAGTLAILGVGLVHLFVMLAFAFYLLRDDHRIGRWFLGRFGDADGTMEAYARAVDADFDSIFFGNILNAALTGTIAGLPSRAVRAPTPPGTAIPYPTLLGLLAGVGSLVPVIGMKLVYVPAAVYLAAVGVLQARPGFLWLTAAFVVVSFVVVDTIPDLVLRPYVSGRSLHVGAVMLAYTLGPLLFGWYGIFLMPMLLVLVVHFARIVLPELMAGERIRPYALDPSVPVEDTAVDRYGSAASDPALGADADGSNGRTAGDDYGPAPEDGGGNGNGRTDRTDSDGSAPDDGPAPSSDGGSDRPSE